MRYNGMHMRNNQTPSPIDQELQGEVIKEIFKDAERVADLHATLTSPRGEFFRRRLLQLLSDGLTQEEIERLKREFGMVESRRHLNKFLEYRLITEEEDKYRRTDLGERAVNAVREMERKVGEQKAQPIWQAALGKNSISLFLKLYGSPKKPTQGMDIIYTPLEIGQIARFLPRTIEGISATDKLDDAGLVSYMEDGNIHINPRRSTAFYSYLKILHSIFQEAFIK